MLNRPLLLAVAWTLLIVALCSIPGDDIPEVTIWGYDKLGHFVMFAGFGWLWAWVAPKRALGWVLVAGIAFAVLTEVYQGLLPFDRTPDLYDVLADLAGLFAALFVYHLRTRRQVQRQVA